MTTIDLGPLDQFTDGAGTRVVRDGLDLSVVRIADDVYVIGDRCTHATASLSEGDVDVDTLHIECWRHGSSFSLLTGEPDVLPATQPTPVYDANVIDGNVIVSITPNEDGGS